MQAKLLLTFVGFGLILCAGCGNSADSMLRESLACQSELAAVLPTIRDEATAKAATPKLKAIGARIQENSKRNADLHLTESQQAALAEKYQPHMEEGLKIASEMLRIIHLNINDKDFQAALASCGASSSIQQ